jgi:hypothetical protein
MVDAGKAYVKLEEDENGNPKTFRIFSSDGAVIFFEDVEKWSRDRATKSLPGFLKSKV